MFRTGRARHGRPREAPRDSWASGTEGETSGTAVCSAPVVGCYSARGVAWVVGGLDLSRGLAG